MSQTRASSTEYTVKIAAAQYPFDEVASPEAWLEKQRLWIKDGADTGADILVFPEYAAMEVCAWSGRDTSGDLHQSLHKVADLNSWRVGQLQSIAAECNVTLIAGSGPVHVDGGAIANEAQIITPSGAMGYQRKLMMTPFERSWGISPGQHVHVFELEKTRVAIAICYDVEFPLLVRAAAQHDAEIIFVPSCTEHASGYARVRTGACARALENTIATVQSATIGSAPWCPAIDYNTGAAGLYVPAEKGLSETGVLAEGRLNEPGWVTSEIDLDALRKLRVSGEMRNFEDWTGQPGADAVTLNATVVDLATAKPIDR